MTEWGDTESSPDKNKQQTIMAQKKNKFLNSRNKSETQSQKRKIKAKATVVLVVIRPMVEGFSFKIQEVR